MAFSSCVTLKHLHRDHSSDSVPVVFVRVWKATISIYVILIASLLQRVIYTYDENIPVVMSS